MNDGLFLLFIVFVFFPLIYILSQMRVWKEKADLWDKYQKDMYSGYVQNIEEILRSIEEERLTQKTNIFIKNIVNVFDILKHLDKKVIRIRGRSEPRFLLNLRKPLSKKVVVH